MTNIDTFRVEHPTATPARRLQRASRAIVEAIDKPLRRWQQRHFDRAQLRDMPEYLLRDLGIDVATARREAEKPFWQA